jgi:hypothetical protein
MGCAEYSILDKGKSVNAYENNGFNDCCDNYDYAIDRSIIFLIRVPKKTILLELKTN